MHTRFRQNSYISDAIFFINEKRTMTNLMRFFYSGNCATFLLVLASLKRLFIVFFDEMTIEDTVNQFVRHWRQLWLIWINDDCSYDILVNIINKKSYEQREIVTNKGHHYEDRNSTCWFFNYSETDIFNGFREIKMKIETWLNSST